jgi:sterol desaturase/sphingolipid hydroxylase (fatty acid hydroxylase superfamily)
VPELPGWLRLTPFAALLDAGHAFFVPALASSLALALLLYGMRRPAGGLREFLLPARLYRTRAFRIDLGFALLNQSLYLVLVTAFALGADRVAEALVAAAARLGVTGAGLAFGPAALAAFGLAAFLARDLGVFVAHALQHRVPLLWAFHKVHHTTTALTPLSALRAHPVDDLFTQALVACLTGAVAAGFRLVYDGAPAGGSVAATSLAVLGFHLAGHHLRHSHVWLSYGPVLGRLLVSPAHHQVHHSRAPRHWNRNLGQFLAVWDWAFGTLYVPGREPEPLAYGVSEAEDARFDSVPRLYLLPFADAARALCELARLPLRYARSTAATLSRTTPSSSSSTSSGTLSGGVT